VSSHGPRQSPPVPAPRRVPASVWSRADGTLLGEATAPWEPTAQRLVPGLLFFFQANARRTPGWTRVWNPGAAYREVRSERDAVTDAGLDVADTGSDEPGI
jgi:hypothetical protein